MIDSFSGEFRWLSNFFTLDSGITLLRVWRGVLSNFTPAELLLKLPTTEHGYQVSKTLVQHERVMVLHRCTDVDGVPRCGTDVCTTAGQAKRTGQLITKRTDWEAVRLAVMNILVRQKFQDPSLGRKLVATYPYELVEGNWWHDIFYGACTCPKHQGVGENHLGKILMCTREELRTGQLRMST